MLSAHGVPIPKSKLCDVTHSAKVLHQRNARPIVGFTHSGHDAILEGSIGG